MRVKYYFIQHHGQADTISVREMQQAHWANEIAVEEHEHVVIKLASDTDSSSDTDTVFGPRAYESSL